MNESLGHLLLVDDDPHQLKLMKLILEDHGYAVHTARDGQEALEVIPLNPPDGVISDVLMPRLDGYQLCHSLRQDIHFSHLPIVLLSSAYTEPEDIELAKTFGANALLTRTSDASNLAGRALEMLKMALLPETKRKWSPRTYESRLARQLELQVKAVQEGARKMTQLEEQLRHSQKLESIGQITAGVAHELNNPLGAILGFTQCLLDDPQATDIVDVLNAIQGEGLRCRTLIQDMLTFARKPALQTAWERLPQLADSILGLIAARAKTMKVAIEKKYDENLPPALVMGNQIQQVLINLCNNALDAMPKGGTLCMTIGLSGSHFILRVSDTGEGMSQERAKRVFEPFFTTKGAGKGTGLGLSLVQNIVTNHKGRVGVQSELGRGTTFEVILPRGGTCP